MASAAENVSIWWRHHMGWYHDVNSHLILVKWRETIYTLYQIINDPMRYLSTAVADFMAICQRDTYQLICRKLGGTIQRYDYIYMMVVNCKAINHTVITQLFLFYFLLVLLVFATTSQSESRFAILKFPIGSLILDDELRLGGDSPNQHTRWKHASLPP